ncbi:FecR family protein [Chitinophaga polysaccharea]|uniref:FecR family protein n=1 Tax=Chitinophaga TaxID=79328 RepID=UPI001455166B|nr:MULTISPECIES: FecR family protein [Chitinophaga]NLR61654.1 FecR family protein [Chitinophaga polysaccharea]NLU93751.1 FecR family protein [Chitinophaga sp. Ak27]
MDSQHLRELLQQHLNNALPVEDLRALIDHLRENGHSEDLLSVIEEALESGTFTGQTDKSRKDQLFQDILRKTGKEEAVFTEEESSQPLIKRHTRIWKAAAAAMIILLAGTATYLIRKPAAHRGTIINQVAKADVLPGSNKAILTLTDGSHIELDSAARGTLTQQGAAAVMKLNNGQLAYQTSNRTGADVVYNTVSTPRGGQYQIVLPDGTKVWLNAASSLHFPTSFTGKERVVEVTGEAYFEVARKENQPFKVVTQEMEVKVLGTHFNVNAYADETASSTVLLEGKVMVFHRGKNVLMTPGQQALVKEDIRIVPHADIETLMAWKEGKFSYNNMGLETIMRQIARWYDVDIIFEDKIADSYSMEISRNVPLSKLLQFMEISGGVHFVINGRKVIVRK